ncbi:protein NO VEIN domain-containing protein [Aurantiacibacter luteus]|nr:DUF3883 domain-containing protein [Aurantiacibacter luteus]
MSEPSQQSRTRPYTASLIGNIRAILTGLQGFEAMARELIQNADDARAEEMVFDIDGDALRIWNSGKFSSCETQDGHCPWEVRGNPHSGTKRACDFHAISTVGSGNKYGEEGLIGRFGIGFVSVYQVTDKPIIRSGKTQLELDPLAGQASEMDIALRDGSVFELPWCFDGRSSVRETLNASPLLPEELDILERDLVSVAEDCLLFLRNLRSLEIRRNGVTISKVQKTDLGENRLRLAYAGSDHHEDWYVIHFDAHEAAASLRRKYPVIDRLDRQTNGQIAFRLGDLEERVGRLYAYLPTEQDAPIPCHINADFFPEQTRRALVLSGQQHERLWNEMLLQSAAREVASHLIELRDVLGAKRLWDLIDEANDNRSSAHFKVFWNEIERQAKVQPIAITALGEWVRPADCKIGSADFEKPEYDSLSKIGVQVLDPELSNHRQSLLALGGGSLTFHSFVDAWDRWLGDHRESELISKVTAKTNSFMAPLWRIANRFVGEIGSASLTEQRALDRLSSLPFAPSSEGSLLPIRSLFRLPKKLKIDQISEFFPGLSFVVDTFSKYPNLNEHIERLTLDDLFAALRAKADQDDPVSEWLGNTKSRLRSFYELLADCPTGDDDPDSEIVYDIPFLIGSDGAFLSPKQAVIPSDFTDPVGRFDTLDMSFFEGRVEDLLKKRLHIEALTFEKYVEEHLEEILEGGLEDRQYAALVDELTSHPKILENDRLRRRLQDLPLVWTNADEFRLPRDCYVKTTKLVEILGDDQSRWVKSSMLKRTTRDNFEKAFLPRLGMRDWPTLRHVIERLEEIVAEDPSEASSTPVLGLLDVVFDIFQKGKIYEKEDAYAEEIDWLRTTEWLPAIREGTDAVDTRFWYAPHELYQHLRADGFSSQVPYLAIQPGQKTKANKKFLDFLEMPAEPGTSDIVDHLLDCLESEREPSKTTYELLSERLKKEDDLPALERLLGQPIIYDPRTKRFLSLSRVSWNKPPFPHYLYPAPKWMRDLEELFEFLGVEDSPDLEAFVDVALEIVENYEDNDLPAVERNILEECLAKISSAIRNKIDTILELLSKLEKRPFLPTRSNALSYVDEVIVCDNASLADSFDGAIDHLLIEERLDQRELRNHLGLMLLSRRTHREAVDLDGTKPDEAASTLLSERSSLLMWLVPSLGSQAANKIATSLRSTKIVRTNELTVRSVLELQDQTIESEPKAQDALFEEDDRVLYVQASLGDKFWIPAFRAVFDSLTASELGVDVGHLAMCAFNVVAARDEEDARSILQQAGFREPAWATTETIDYGETEDLGELSQPPHSDDDVQEDEESADDSHDEGIEIADEHDGIDEPQGEGQGLGDGKAPSDGKTPLGGHASDQHIRADRNEHGGSERSGSSDGADEPTNGEGKTSTSGNNDGRSKGKNGEPRERKPSLRTQRLRSYVLPKGDERSSSDQRGSNKERIDEIDKAAMAAVVDWEGKRGFDPRVQSHYNPGFDIISEPKEGGETRYIEVKGLADAWTERGVKLSRTQMQFAREKSDDFWLYVVEHALDPKKRNVHAIRNPFEKSDEFWFDQGWIDIAEEKSGDQRMLLKAGRRIEVKNWGRGTILKVDRRGIGIQLTIKFMLATKMLTYNFETFELLED